MKEPLATHPASLPAAERQTRSRLAQLVHSYPLLRGTLTVRARQCGKPNCRCARGQLHVSLYLVQSRDGSLRQLCVPQDWQDRVRQAVHNYRQMQQLLEELSEREWKRLQQRKE